MKPEPASPDQSVPSQSKTASAGRSARTSWRKSCAEREASGGGTVLCKMEETSIESDEAGKGPNSIVPQMQGLSRDLQNFYKGMERGMEWKMNPKKIRLFPVCKLTHNAGRGI